MRAKTFWVSRAKGSLNVGVHPKKPKRVASGERIYFTSKWRHAYLCARDFRRMTGLALSMKGDGLYRVTMTLRKER